MLITEDSPKLKISLVSSFGDIFQVHRFAITFLLLTVMITLDEVKGKSKTTIMVLLLLSSYSSPL